jgi:glycosyltransferase involved in cell wall biosynthesis
MLAHTGHDFFVLNHTGRFWDLRMRPVPGNVHIIEGALDSSLFFKDIITGKLKIDRIILQDAFAKTNQGTYLIDDVTTEYMNIPKILLFHNSFQTNFNEPEMKEKIKEKTKGFKKVFISEFKKKSWNEDGAVIKPGFDLEEWGGWRGIVNRGLVCLNNAMHRDFMNNTTKIRLVGVDYPINLLGEEDGKGELANNFEHLKNYYKDFRWYICLNNPDYEDGYNLSMLEAMATGMPAVTLDHPSTPIKSGINGFKSDDIQAINKFLHTATWEEAHNLGRQARETVKKEFPMDAFIDNWNKVLEMP